MSKVMVSELSRLLSNMPKEEAEKFIGTFFQVLMYGLEKDKSVKIKGLGTFKLTRAKTKLSFSPDITMRDAVNKPFSHFEAVMLNDGVTFDDIVEEECEDFAAVEKMEETEQDVCFVTSAVMEKLADNHSATAQTSTNAFNNQSNEDRNRSENQPVAEKDETNEDTKPAKDEKPSVGGETPAGDGTSKEEPKQALAGEPVMTEELSVIEEATGSSTKKWWIAAVAACLIAGLGFLFFHPTNKSTENLANSSSLAADSTVVATATADSVSQAKAAVDAQAQFDELNAKIPYGAYEIVGVDTVITVSKGMTLDDIARIFLGTEMQVYLVVMNDGNDSPTEGQSYKIPRLRLK